VERPDEERDEDGDLVDHGLFAGLGRALAEDVLGRGHNAVVTARDPAAVRDLVEAHPESALGVALDVTDPVQVSDVVGRAAERFGRIDVLVNNAGYGYRAAVEEGDEADVRRLFDTNLFGAVAMIKAVLPGMRAPHRDDRERLVDRSPGVPTRLGVLLGDEGGVGGDDQRVAQGDPAARPDRDGGRAGRVPH
jgi:NAD(P)-dependent dehydrogenase (short-subunit alcohol dehydrogenase family)